jgi:hypothetical protein
MTDLAGALRAAAAQLAGADAEERVAVLLSDCLRTAGAADRRWLRPESALARALPAPQGVDWPQPPGPEGQRGGRPVGGSPTSRPH